MFELSEIQRELHDLVATIVTDQVSGDTVRTVMLDTGVDVSVWGMLVDAGVATLLIPEEHGGAGASFADAMVVAEVLARAVTPVPYLSSSVLVPTFLAALDSSPARESVYAGLVAGERASVVYRDAQGDPAKPSGVTAQLADGGVTLNGTSGHVLDGAGATHLLVVARHGEHDVAVWVPRDTNGVTVTPVAVLDLTRPLATLTFDGCVVPVANVLHGDVTKAVAAMHRAARVALAREAVGGLDALLVMTTAYARDRLQFGRAIGSFQAVKHRLVDVLIQKEAALSAAAYASGMCDEDDATEADISSLTAAAYCLPAYATASATCLQIFGGIGFTWEHDVHLHLKRAKASSLLFGSATHHRRELARVLAL